MIEERITRRSSRLGGLAPMKVGRFFLVCFVRWIAKSVEAPKPINAALGAKSQKLASKVIIIYTVYRR